VHAEGNQADALFHVQEFFMCENAEGKRCALARPA
jgi:hypothetical protein